MREDFYLIGVGGGDESLGAVAQRGQDRPTTAGGSFHVDFVSRIALDPEKKSRAGYLFEAGVLDPQLVSLFGLEHDGDRHAQKMRANERETGFALQDGGFELTFKEAVNHCELPARRW